MPEALTSDNFNEHTDCVMVGHRWVDCDCNFPCGFKICDECSEEEQV